MRILVTGGTGFIGSHTARALAVAGHRVRLLVRDLAKAKRVFAREQECASFECVPGDIVDSDAVDTKQFRPNSGELPLQRSSGRHEVVVHF